MKQPEIIFCEKLIRMRFVTERLGGNKKPGVFQTAEWLNRHIQANGYSKPNESKSFFIRHCEKIEYLIPSGKPKLRKEYEEISKR